MSQTHSVKHILLSKWTLHGCSPSIRTDPNTLQNYSKLIDLVVRIELTRAILMQRIFNFLGNLTIHFRMFLYLGTCFLKVTVSLLCWLQAVCSNLSLSNYLKGDQIVRPCDRHSNEKVTLSKYFTKYKHTRKSMIEFLGKF